MSLIRARVKISRAISFVDIILLVGIFASVYALVGVAQDWAGPYRPKTEIDLSFISLIQYSVFSLIRVFAAYLLSLAFTFSYGYIAAKSKVAEPILIPLLDILQSVPVLGFMPGLVLALVSLFPHSNLGLELAAIVMIFTGQGWNMVFSFYSSLKNVPVELREMSQLFRLRKWDELRTIELPFSANGLIWNSMVSMAGGWFFLMVIESFSLGDKDFRLPGIGSYMAVAYEHNDKAAVIAGILAMFTLIIIVDRFLWAPLVVWSDRFRFNREERGLAPHSLVAEWLKRSVFFGLYHRGMDRIRKELVKRRDQSIREPSRFYEGARELRKGIRVFRWIFVSLGMMVLVYGFKSMYELVAATTLNSWLWHIRDTLLTFIRVMAAVALGSLWTIPLGVFIGTHPVWTRRLQPVVQVVASFPAPMLFPLITLLFIRCGVSLQWGSVVLMLFASQWYILFNVISGATLIPHQLLDVAQVFQVRGWEYWRAIIIPAIFPSLVNGLITAAGGAWNACIVAEMVTYSGGTLTATGIGASITRAAQAGDFPALAGAVLTMVSTVVILNRVLWGSLYRLAETKFRLES